jgi:group I intron endonuclease
MKYYVYKITNNVNGKIYVGVTRCDDCIAPIDHNYFGSGKLIKLAHKKYGLENFTKEIIDICDSKNTASELESLIVDEDFVNNKNTYNIKLGGYDGGHSEETKLKISVNNAKNKYWKGKPSESHPMFGKHHSDETKLKISVNNARSHLGNTGELCPNFGKKHSEATKLKMSIKRSGKNNPNYGKEFSEEHKAKLAAAKRGKPMSLETKAKISAAFAIKRQLKLNGVTNV